MSLRRHYVITGTEGTPYEGGYYHGKLKFPTEYPLRPPAVLMLTPSGRFKTNRRLCLSMSDFHPESWNPMWSVSTILTGLCVERQISRRSAVTYYDTGTVLCSRTSRPLGASRRRMYVHVMPVPCRLSVDAGPTPETSGTVISVREQIHFRSNFIDCSFNCNDANFRELFSDLVELYEQRQRQARVGPSKLVDGFNGTKQAEGGSAQVADHAFVAKETPHPNGDIDPNHQGGEPRRFYCLACVGVTLALLALVIGQLPS